MKKTKLWYVIADGGRARFVERDEAGAFRTVASFVSTELHERSHDLGLDRPARLKESAGPTRHAVEPRRDLHEAAKENFVLRNDPFRSLAGAVRESCGFEKGDKSSSAEDYLEFQWADYLRAHWAQTGIATKADTNLDSATDEALHLAAEKEAASLPGYTGRISCD